MNARLTILALALVLPTGGVGQSPIVIHAGQVLDGTGEALGPATIVVEGTTITSVAEGAAPSATYDLSDLTVMPGGMSISNSERTV